MASTQGTQNRSTDGNIVRAATLEEYKKNPEFAKEMGEAPKPDETLYPGYEYPAAARTAMPLTSGA